MNEKKTTYTRDTDKPFDDSDIDYSGIDNLSDDEVHEGLSPIRMRSLLRKSNLKNSTALALQKKWKT